MGNSIGVKKRTAKVMKIDGTAFRLKPPVQVSDVLRDHPGFTLLESGEVKLLGVRAKPLGPDVLLKAGKLYFLVELPKLPDKRAPRRAWSGALQVGARERLETLMLTRRSTSDISLGMKSPSIDSEEVEGGLRLKMRLPKNEVAKLMQESKDSNEAAERIMQLIKAHEASSTPSGLTPVMTPMRSRSPLRSPVMTPTGSLTPAMKSPLRSPVMSHARLPERWPSLARLPELETPDVKDGRKEKRTRFLALPDEIIARN
ncbi:hypothetical protein LUZ60_000204 [Juncus effusus]|nr:hypothetical protein LUZ60_000204 [Juncus effusus]